MSLAIYKNLSVNSVTIGTLDTSGTRPTTVVVPSGELFLGDNNDPLLNKLVASNFAVLVLPDVIGVANGTLLNWNEGNQFTSFQVGTSGPELLVQMYGAYLNYWEWC